MSHLVIALVLAVPVVVGVWLIDLAWHPTRPCRRCNGTGKNWGSTKRRYGACGRCGGTGRELRRGAHKVRPDLRR